MIRRDFSINTIELYEFGDGFRNATSIALYWPLGLIEIYGTITMQRWF